MKPHENFRERPKKTGARKKQRILSQKKRLIALGCDEKSLNKMTIVDIRELLKKKMMRKKGKQ